MADTLSEPDVTLAFFLEVMAARVNRLQTSETRPFRVRGIPIRPTNPRPYGDGQVYSGSLKDPRTRAVIEARYPASLLDQVEWGAEAVVVGTVVYRLDPQGVIRPLLKVDSVERTGGAKVVSKADLMERWQAAVTRAKRDPAMALSAERPVVAVVTGGGSVALDDILAQLGGLVDDVDVRRLDVPLTAPEAVAEAVRGLADVHLAVVTRGGGADVHELDHEAVLGAVAGASVPVAVAAGHESDRLVLGRVADVSFPTPTAFGAWLRARLEDRRQSRAREEAVREVGRTRDLVREVQELAAKNQMLVKQAEGMGAEVGKLQAAQAEADIRVKDLLARSATAEGRNEALARELVELQRVRAELEAASAQRQTLVAEAQSRQAALEAEKSVLENLRDSLWGEVKGLRAAQSEAEKKVNEAAVRAAALEGRNESLALELARLQSVRKELEALTARRQDEASEARAEVEALRKRLEQVPEYHVPAVYKAAPWLLAGAAVVLALTGILVVLLLMVR